MLPIETIEELVTLVQARCSYPEELGPIDVSGVDWKDFGDVDSHYYDGMVLFSYSRECQFKPPEEWNFFERISRGLIIDVKTGDILARPFDKFWNYGQVQPAPGSRIVDVSEKMDGSLGILYRRHGEYWIATRGSFTSDQAVWATKWYREHIQPNFAVPTDVTLLFEIIYPENRIVVDYRKDDERRESLILIGARRCYSGEDYFMVDVQKQTIPLHYGRPLMPQIFKDLQTTDQVLESAKSLSGNEEGFVVRYDDGTRVKIKGEEYLRLHRFVSSLTFKRVCEALRDNQIDDYRSVCPQEFRLELEEMVSSINSKLLQWEPIMRYFHVYCHERAREMAETGVDYKKAYALQVQEHFKEHSAVLFRLRDGKAYRDLMFKKLFDI